MCFAGEAYLSRHLDREEHSDNKRDVEDVIRLPSWMKYWGAKGAFVVVAACFGVGDSVAWNSMFVSWIVWFEALGEGSCGGCKDVVLGQF